MTSTLQVSNITSFNRLIELWTSQYTPSWSGIINAQPGMTPTALSSMLSAQRRSDTVRKIKRYLQLNCELAGIETHGLFSQFSSVLNLAEVRKLAVHVERVYGLLLQYYEQYSVGSFSTSDTIGDEIKPTSIVPLMSQLEPILATLREQHLQSQDPRAVGFVTTQFHFSTRAIFKQLSALERVLIEPYFRFAEEQVCIPWQLVCQSATVYAPDSLEMQIMNHVLPISSTIAESTYQRSLQQFPKYASRRGLLSQADVKASVLRDLKMFQGFLWLSFLEGNLETMQRQLLPACLMVFPTVQVSWQLVDQMLQVLMTDIQSRLTDEQWIALSPITESFREVFAIPD